MSKRRSSNMLPVEIRQPKTSTPLRGANRVPPPMFSESSSITHSETSSTAGDASELLTDTENEVVIPSSVRATSRNTKDAQYFKPQVKESLYYHVITEEIDVETLAGLWISRFESNPARATSMMMQLFVDIAGFQHLRIPNMDDLVPQDLIKELERDIPTVLSEYTYLLATNSKWSKNAIHNISKFLDEITDCASSTKIIFQCNLFNHVLKLLKCMAECKLYAIKHTGVFIALKLCVGFGKILDQYKRELVALDPTGESWQGDKATLIAEWKAKNRVISKLAHYSLQIVLAQCAIFEYQRAVMHATCATDFSKLYFLLSHHESQAKMLYFIMFASRLNDVYLRFCCIKALKHILTMPNCYEADKTIPKVLDLLMDAILDDSLDVACEAILAMKIAVRHYSAFIKPAYKSTLAQCLYNKNYVKGAAAGQYFYMVISSRTNTRDELFREIAEFQCMALIPNRTELLPLLVESLLDAVQEFHHPQMLIDYILQSNIPLDREIVLVEILSHVVSQILTGKASIERDGCRKGKCDQETTDEIIDEVVPKLQSLFDKYVNKQYQQRCIDALLFMMGNFTYDDNSFLQYRLEMKELFKIFNKIFNKTNCESTLLKISEILWRCVQDTDCLKTASESILRTLMTASIDMYAHLVKTTTWEEEDLKLLEVTLMKLNAIMRYHEIPINWDFDFVNKLFSDEAKLDHIDLVCIAEKCSNTYVLMNVQTFVEESSSGTSPAQRKHTAQSLKAIINQHLNICFENLVTDSTILQTEAFKLICKLYTDMRGFSANEILKNVMPELSQGQQKLLIQFLRENVFKRSANPKTTGSILQIFIDTVCVRGFSLSILPHVFAYCNLFFEKYGDYYIGLMKELFKCSKVIAAAIIFWTLKNEFENLVMGNTVCCGTFTDLKKLSLQLYNIAPKSLCYLVTRYSFMYSVDTPKNMKFIHYTMCFYNNLRDEERKKMLQFMDGIHSDEVVLSKEFIRQFVAKMRGNSSQQENSRDEQDI